MTVAAVSIRNLPEETHRALKQRAASHGRSAEAEVRAILEAVLRPNDRVKIGTALHAIGRRLGGVEMDAARDRSPAGTVSFE
jgi:antitoxin FitA